MPKKKTATRKTTTKKSPTRKKAAKKATKKSASKKSVSPASKAKGSKPKASELIKRNAHTPAVFKTSGKRPAAILFSIEEVREVLKKRAIEEAKEKAAAEKENPVPTTKLPGQAIVNEVEPPKKSKHQAASLDDILGLSGGSSGPQGANNIPKKFQKFYNLLMELRKEVRDELNLHTSDTLKRSQKEDAGDIATSVDAGTDNFDRDFALSLLSSEQEALNEIEAAIKRIHKGTYGVCEVTGEPIKEDRLEAVPFTRFSVEGQKQYEMNLRKRVSRAGAFLNEASGEKITFGDDDGDN